MADDRQANLTLLAKVDEATIQRSIKRLRDLAIQHDEVVKGEKRISDASKRLASDLGPLNSVSQKRIDLLRRDMELAEKQARANDKLAKSIEKEADARRKVNAETSKRGRQQLTALAGGTSALGGLESLAGAGPAGDILRSVSAIARLKSQVDQFAEASEGAAGATGKATAGLSGLGGSLAGLAAAGVAAVALAAMSIAIAKFVEDLNRYQQIVSVAADAQVRYYELLQSGTAEEIQAEMKRIEVKKNAIEWARRDAETSRLATEAWSGFSGAIARLLGILGITTKKEKEYADQLAEINAQYDAYNRALSSQEVQQRNVEQSTKSVTAAENARSKALDEAKRKEEERTRAIKQAAQDISQARMREVQAEASASQKRIEKMADIARQFAQSSADALRELQEDQADLVIKFGQEQADAILESQRDEERAARDHSRAIKSIRDKAALDEFNATRERDFARLVEIRRGVEQEVSEETERFAAERQEANVALRQRLQDAHVAYQRERSARLTEYNNQLIELRINKARQQAEARIAYSRDIANLRQSLQNEIALKQQALQATLGFTRQWVRQMMAVVGQTPVSDGGGHTGGGSTGGSGAGVVARAFGGPLSTGQTSLVNELGPERWMSGGNSVMLPGGAGLFTPLRGGTVQPAGGISVIQHIYPTPGMSEERVAQIAAVKIRQAFKGLVA